MALKFLTLTFESLDKESFNKARVELGKAFNKHGIFVSATGNDVQATGLVDRTITLTPQDGYTERIKPKHLLQAVNMANDKLA